MAGVRHMFRATVVVAIAMALLPAVAPAAKKKPAPGYQWATINICDTLRHPNEMGVRASMPGNGTYQRMYMRFRAQFYNSEKKKYENVQGSGFSGWIYAGSARYKYRQAGFTFSFDPPGPGASFTLRGLVDLQWRQKQKTKSGKLRWLVVRKAQLITKAGLKGVRGSDPPGFSSGVCEIR